MTDKISPQALNGLLEGDASFALIDVREAGEYNSTHIPGSSLISRRHLEFQMPAAVPFLASQVVLCDDDGRRAELAAATLAQMGYGRVSFLDGGINRWTSQDYPTEWGSNVPSKEFDSNTVYVGMGPLRRFRGELIDSALYNHATDEWHVKIKTPIERKPNGTTV